MVYMIEGGSSKTYSKSKRWLYMYPEESSHLLRIITRIVIDYLVEQVKAGAQVKSENANLFQEIEKFTSLEFYWVIFIFLIFIFLILLIIFKAQMCCIFVIIFSVFLNDILH